MFKNPITLFIGRKSSKAKNNKKFSMTFSSKLSYWLTLAFVMIMTGYFYNLVTGMMSLDFD